MSPRRYRVAGRTVVSDRPIDELRALEQGQLRSRGLPTAPGQPAGGTEGELLFAGSGWVADGHRRVECRRDDGAYRIAIGGLGELWVATDGGSIGCSHLAPGLDPLLARLALLGPALTLALAAQGTFCLHASAVEAGSGVLAFAGESGAGKSTLARMLEGAPTLGYRRVADDLLPLDLPPGRPMARSDFPQLKLAEAEQPYLSGPSSLPLRAVFVLAPPDAGQPPRESVEVVPLSAKTATLALIRHTVASRLFDAGLLERQLRASAGLARAIPVWRLSYPWGQQSPSRIAEAIEASCTAAAGMPDAETPATETPDAETPAGQDDLERRLHL